MSIDNQKMKETFQSITNKARYDEEFRKRALKQPHKVVEEVLGEEITSDIKITFVDGSKELAVTLPPANKELAESELDNITGGLFTKSPDFNPFNPFDF